MNPLSSYKDRGTFGHPRSCLMEGTPVPICTTVVDNDIRKNSYASALLDPSDRLDVVCGSVKEGDVPLNQHR